MTDNETDPTGSFAKALNAHGYPFQYAVLNEVSRSFAGGATTQRYYADVAEFPVIVRGANTKIDFVLRHTNQMIYLICECKRADPKFADWCFLRTPFERVGRTTNFIFADGIKRAYGGGACIVSPVRSANIDNQAYHLGIELRSNGKGESSGGRTAIEDTAGQVLRGLNGLIEYYHAQPNDLDDGHSKLLLPVIFTTATLWVSGVDLASTDLRSGEIKEPVDLEPRDWLVLQYHMSPSLKHGAMTKLAPTLAQALDDHFIRSIIIVSTPGVSDALTWLSALPPAG